MKQLRELSKITSDEFAYVAGDLLVAENIKTSEKRVLGQAATILSESNRRVLKG
tara:strand:+ start:1582 stop:1743 length:162 start_codon:yes stop_codon:yes gene_type:complete